MKLFVDDEREPGYVYDGVWVTRLGKEEHWNTGWIIVRDAETAKLVLSTGKVGVISLDHDLGTGQTGYDLAKWMTENKLWPKEVHFHSANPVGVSNMAKEWAFYLKTLPMREEEKPDGTV